MEKIDMLEESNSTIATEEEHRAEATAPAPLSPMKKAKEIEFALNQENDDESKLLALAQIIKKDRKKHKTLKQALAKEIELNQKLEKNIAELNDQIGELNAEVKDKDERIVKTYADYMSTYEALLQLKNDKGIPKATRK